MKQDIFDDVAKAKKSGGHQKMGKEPPKCPSSDHMTPFFNVAFAGGELYVRLDSADGPCHKLITVGGANFSVLQNASKTCGPVGEWKKRVAEEMSMVFFQGGLDWVKSENETIEVITEDAVTGLPVTFQVEVSEAKYASMMECWKRSCGCEQADNPKTKMVLFALLLCALGGLSWDSIKLGLESFRGKKPDKHVQCKKGHRMVEVNFAYSHLCDICRKSGTCYQCNVSCNYDMCKLCYKAAKKKTKAALKVYLEKHPEDEDNKKKDKKDKDDSDDDTKKDKNDDSQSEGGKETKEESEAPSEADKDGTTPPTTGDEKAKSEKSEEDN